MNSFDKSLNTETIRVAFFGEAAFPSHNIKWINHLVENFPLEAVLFTFNKEDTSHISEKIRVYNVLKYYPLFDIKNRNATLTLYKGILDENKIDLLHFLWGVDIVLWARFLNRPYLITTRGSDVLRILPQRYVNVSIRLNKRSAYLIKGKRLHQKAFKEAAWVTSTSLSQMSSLLGIQSKIRNHSIIRTGAYSIQFYFPKRLLTESIKVVFSPRSMKELYNQDVIIEAFKSYLDYRSDAVLRMVDNYPQSEWSNKIRSMVDELGIGKSVIFLTDLSQKQMSEEYSKADVSVMIPQSDGAPVSAIESMMAGCPVILGDNDYDNDLFNESTIWKLENNKSKDLVEKLIQVDRLDLRDLILKVKNAQSVALNNGSTEVEMRRLFSIYLGVLTLGGCDQINNETTFL